jgi:cobalt-zinc-cadmium efflux system protein
MAHPPHNGSSHGHHGHDHQRGHGQDHGHGHPAPTSFGPRFLLAAALNVLFIAFEVIYGLQANSLALLADAGHNVSDVLGLMIAWAAWGLSRRKPDASFTYGLRSASILAALFNALLLMIAVGGIVWEAAQRFTLLQAVAGETVMWVAALGILINGFTAWLFAGGQADLNIRGAFLHLVADAAVSAAVVVSGFIILRTGWQWIDPALSIAVSAVIVWGTWGLLRESVRLALQGVPKGIDSAAVRSYLAALPGVRDVHDLHVWGMSTTEVALTAHITVPAGHPGDGFLHEAADELEHRFGIGHVTIQIETGDGQRACALSPDESV